MKLENRGVLSLACIAAIHGFPVALAVPEQKPTPAPAVKPRLTEALVIRLATRAAVRDRRDLLLYEEPRKPRFHPEDRTWAVLFEAKKRRPGGYFIVLIDDHTEKATVHPGE